MNLLWGIDGILKILDVRLLNVTLCQILRKMISTMKTIRDPLSVCLIYTVFELGLREVPLFEIKNAVTESHDTRKPSLG